MASPKFSVLVYYSAPVTSLLKLTIFKLYGLKPPAFGKPCFPRFILKSYVAWIQIVSQRIWYYHSKYDNIRIGGYVMRYAWIMIHWGFA